MWSMQEENITHDGLVATSTSPQACETERGGTPRLVKTQRGEDRNPNMVHLHVGFRSLIGGFLRSPCMNPNHRLSRTMSLGISVLCPSSDSTLGSYILPSWLIETYSAGGFLPSTRF